MFGKFGITRRQMLICGTSFAAVIAAWQSSALAAASPIWDDRVDMVNQGKVVGYEIWYNDYGWMLRTTNKKGNNPVRFVGRIQVTNGKFKKVSSGGSDKGDKFKLSTDKDTVTFDFLTNATGIDGINFEFTPGSTAVVFSLDINGKTDDGKRILIGPKTNPNTNPFALPAFPKKN